MIRTFITIDGIDGSGKSTFARRLASALDDAGIRTLIVRVDDFRRALRWNDGGRPEADRYYDEYYDLELCERALQAFSAGAASFEIPVFDTTTEQMAGTRSLGFAGVQLVIVEGVFPRRLPSTANGVSVYLATSEDVARARIIDRDLAKGRTREEIARRIDCRYFPAQRRYHAELAPRDAANVVIDNERPDAPRVLRRDLTGLPPDMRPILDRILPVR